LNLCHPLSTKKVEKGTQSIVEDKFYNREHILHTLNLCHPLSTKKVGKGSVSGFVVQPRRSILPQQDTNHMLEERERETERERGEEEERKRRRREDKEKEISLSLSFQKKKAQIFSPPAAGETPDPG